MEQEQQLQDEKSQDDNLIPKVIDQDNINELLHL